MIIVAASPSLDFTAVPNRERERQTTSYRKSNQQTSATPTCRVTPYQSNPRSTGARRLQFRLKMGTRRAAVSVAVFSRFAIYANVVSRTCAFAKQRRLSIIAA
jgi:hypothetical protein